MKKTKVICTMGPNTNDRELIKQLALSGMDIARFNFSHGDHEEQAGRFALVKSVREEINKPIATLLDTKGPEIRTGVLKDDKKVTLKEGQKFTLTTRDIVGDDTIDMITYEGLAEDVTAGNTILIDDGLIELRVNNVIDGTDIECTVVNGGELGSRKGVNVIGVPKTMDNDLASTDVTYGFISAMSVGTEFIDRLQTTAKSHHRVICCELMGRDAGWITLYAGLAGNAGVCLIPEIPFTIENVAKAIKKRDEMGLPYTVVAVAEGAKYADGTKVIGKIVEDSPDPVRYSGLAAKVADDLEKVIPNHEVRSVNPGHIIRGGDISAYDRILSIRYGVAAVELINEGKFGNVVTINGDKMGYTSLEEVIGAAKVGQQKHVDPNGELVKAAKAIGISFGDE